MSVDRWTGRAFCFGCGYRGHLEVPRQALHAACGKRARSEKSSALLLAESRACHEDLVAEVTLARRRISCDTAQELGLRVVTHRGQGFIAFPYFNAEESQPAYWKLRPANGEKKPMYRIPHGVPSIFYNLPALDALRDDEAPFIVEGEFDVAALHETGEYGVVSVPNGARSHLNEELLNPLHRFRACFIGVDNDAAGNHLAARLQAALHPRTCLRITWKGEL